MSGGVRGVLAAGGATVAVAVVLVAHVRAAFLDLNIKCVRQLLFLSANNRKKRCGSMQQLYIPHQKQEQASFASAKR